MTGAGDARRPPLYVVGCGARKLGRPAAARDLYTGSYFAYCLKTALRMTSSVNVRILSAKYGLLYLTDRIEPYNLTLGEPGAVDAMMIRAQAGQTRDLGRLVIALCPARYADLLEEVWPGRVSRPLDGMGIGEQRGAMARMVPS